MRAGLSVRVQARAPEALAAARAALVYVRVGVVMHMHISVLETRAQWEQLWLCVASVCDCTRHPSNAVMEILGLEAYD